MLSAGVVNLILLVHGILPFDTMVIYRHRFVIGGTSEGQSYIRKNCHALSYLQRNIPFRSLQALGHAGITNLTKRTIDSLYRTQDFLAGSRFRQVSKLPVSR